MRNKWVSVSSAQETIRELVLIARKTMHFASVVLPVPNGLRKMLRP